MNHTGESNAFLRALMERCAELQADTPPMQWELEKQICTEARQGNWEAVLQLLERTENDVSRETANVCLALAITEVSTEQFRRLLELLPQEEYTGCGVYGVVWCPTGEVFLHQQWKVHVQGTMLMHAVALNRPDLVKILLERGYDVNCASDGAAAALMTDFENYASGWGRDANPYYPYTACPQSRVKVQKNPENRLELPFLQLEGATPLALAVLMGHAECARILTKRGAWLEESPPVSAAMYLPWRESDPGYLAACAVVRETGDRARHRPVLWAMVEHCSVRQLKTAVEIWDYTPQEMIQAARRMVLTLRFRKALWGSYADNWKDLCRRMNCMGQVCPEAVQARDVIGLLLREAMRWEDADMRLLLPVLQGGVLDISEAGELLHCLEQPLARQVFETLTAHCTLTLDRDAVEPEWQPEALKFLLKHVTFLPPVPDRGVSGLTQALLRCGDLRLIRRVLQSGLIPPEESTEELLRCQQERKYPQACRSALLTTVRPRRTEKICPRITDTYCRWFGGRPRNHTMHILEDADWRKWFWPTVQRPFGIRKVRAAGMELEVNHVFFAVLMEGRRDIVEPWLSVLPAGELQSIESMYCEDRDVLVIVTPLCAAALAGQRDMVELLLERGAPLHEELLGHPSSFTDCDENGDKWKSLSLNPVMAAALGGHWDVVKYLRGRGAECDWSGKENQYIWRQFHRGDLQETARQKLEGHT